MTTERALYVYALVEAARAPRVPRRGGVPGATRTRAVALGPRRWAVVADVPAAAFAPAAVQARLADLEWVGACALGHERVVEALLSATAVAPMRLLAVFRDEASLLATLRAAMPRLDRTLAAVRGRIEYAVRIWPTPAAVALDQPPTTGAAFLEARAARLAPATAPTPAQKRGTAALLRELTGLAERTRNRAARAQPAPHTTSRQFLVARGQLRAFQAAASRGRRRLQPLGLAVALLGPYPAYSFI